jgi:hypothetical protein
MSHPLAGITAHMQRLVERAMKETDHAECDELTEEHWGVLQERETSSAELDCGDSPSFPCPLFLSSTFILASYDGSLFALLAITLGGLLICGVRAQLYAVEFQRYRPTLRFEHRKQPRGLRRPKFRLRSF